MAPDFPKIGCLLIKRLFEEKKSVRNYICDIIFIYKKFCLYNKKMLKILMCLSNKSHTIGAFQITQIVHDASFVIQHKILINY